MLKQSVQKVKNRGFINPISFGIVYAAIILSYKHCTWVPIVSQIHVCPEGVQEGAYLATYSKD